MHNVGARALRLLGLVLLALQGGSAYSVLTHEAIVDTAWKDTFRPLIESRYGPLTEDAAREAHAYAYGGAIIQDMGYYPFGSKFFSDLVHYVRSGDFVLALLSDAQTPNEFAFALGALAHYAADNNGHPLAVNRTVAILFPKLRRKYGDSVTYEDNPGAHLKTEFGFDVLEVAHGSYAPQAFHDFIGFKVSKTLLERAFQDTYAIPLKDVFKSLDLALGSYRRAVSSLIPEMTKVAWDEKKDEIGKARPGMTRRKFIYNLSRGGYEKEWGKGYERPGLGARFLAVLFRLVPKVGPFKALAFRVPTPQAETMFMASFNRTLDTYRQLAGEVRAKTLLELPDRNLDTGEAAREGQYRMADQASEKLLEKLGEHHETVPGALREKLLSYYAAPNPSVSSKAAAELVLLRQATPR